MPSSTCRARSAPDIPCPHAPLQLTHPSVLLQATAEEIKTAYRQLSMLYHPDKHKDPELRAVRVLTSPLVRAWGDS